MSAISITHCKIISGLADIQQHYKAFLIDAWGVLHDGRQAYPYALDCLKSLQVQGKKVVILSNAARRCAVMALELQALGIGPGLYQSVLSSGELTWKSLCGKSFRGQHGYYLGPPRSRGLLEGLNLNWVDDIESADFILNTGAPEGNPSNTRGSEALMKTAVSRDLPMICANPDLVAIRGGQAGISAGALAQRYKELGGGQITYHGKPHAPVYQHALALLGTTLPSQVLAIGDAYETDIRGGNNAGLDTCLIAAGIHRETLMPLSLQSLKHSTPVDNQPDYACEYLSW